MTSARSPAIALRNVCVSRGGKIALEIDALMIGVAELVAVVGPNGSGKSTLLQVVNGLLPATRGDVVVLGEALRARTALGLRRRCALVFQDPLLLHETVFDNVALGPRFRGDSKQRVEERVERALRAFRCEHLVSRPAHDLSGGETRRVCLARALVCDPELVMLDEPFSALDSPTRMALVQELRDVAVERGTTVVLVTHDFPDVLSFADRAIVLLDGRIVQDASPEAVLRRPLTEAVARWVAMDNIFGCDIEQEAAETRVRLPNGVSFVMQGDRLSGKTACCVAGDAMMLDSAPLDGFRVSMEGRILQVAPGVGLHRVTVDCDGLHVVARVDREKARALRPGEQIYVGFDAARAHLV